MQEVATFPILESKDNVHVLVVDGGMRGEALKYALDKSDQAGQVETTPFDSRQPESEVVRIGQHADHGGFDVVLVGQEDAQHAGVVDHMRKYGIAVCGATAEQSRLESSKEYMKRLAIDRGVPTSLFEVFTNSPEDQQAGHDFIDRLGEIGVVKDDFLAKGKAAAVFKTNENGHNFLDKMYRKEFGNRGQKVIIEAFSEGRERSGHMSISDEIIDVWPAAEDHKQVGEGDTGLMGGGSGVVTPLDWLDPEKAEQQDIDTAKKLGLTVPGMRGFVFPGYKGEDCLEVNMRLGSTEAETHVRRMDSDFLEHVIAIINGTLDQHSLRWKDGYAISIVGAAEGYPDDKIIKRGELITGVKAAQEIDEIEIFLGAVSMQDGELYSDGGRLFDVTAYDTTLDKARAQALLAMEQIRVGGRPPAFRRDIGQRAS